MRGEAWPWRARPARYSSGRGPGPPAVSELDKADAWLLRKAHETGKGAWPAQGAWPRGWQGGREGSGAGLVERWVSTAGVPSNCMLGMRGKLWSEPESGRERAET